MPRRSHADRGAARYPVARRRVPPAPYTGQTHDPHPSRSPCQDPCLRRPAWPLRPGRGVQLLHHLGRAFRLGRRHQQRHLGDQRQLQRRQGGAGRARRRRQLRGHERSGAWGASRAGASARARAAAGRPRGQRPGAGAGDPDALVSVRGTCAMNAGRPGACRGHAWWRALLAAACLACAAAVPDTASVLRFDPAGDVDADVAAATRALLDEAELKLPPAMQTLAPVTVRWSDRLPPDVAGRAIRGTLLLNEAMRTALGAVPGDASGQEARERLLATVIHELGHFHDRRAGLSRDPRLLDLAGWQERARKPGREGDNPFSDRSPDRYELASPAEFVAVNLEHFLLDPEYACRRPALYRYFAEHFEWEPGSAGCTPGIPYLDAAADEGDPPLALLDPARVYEVHYLLAEGNHELMSRWGHSMLRLVVCAPGREPGPECRLDLSHHLVLSFRAFVDDVQLSSWAGLTGGYPSRL